MSDAPAMTRADHRKAETMLRSVMVEAERVAERLSIDLAHSSPIGRLAVQHYSRANLSGLHIYHRRPWGWYADVFLKDVPMGVPDALGVPVRSPLGSEAEAYQAGISLVAFIIAADRWHREKKQAPAGDDLFFDFYGVYLGLKSGTVKIAMALADQIGHERTTDQCYQRLDELKTELFGPGEISREKFDALPRMASFQLMAVIAYSIGRGILRCPASVPDLEDWKG